MGRGRVVVVQIEAVRGEQKVDPVTEVRNVLHVQEKTHPKVARLVVSKLLHVVSKLLHVENEPRVDDQKKVAENIRRVVLKNNEKYDLVGKKLLV